MAWGFDPNLRHKLFCGPTWWLDGLVGYRFFRLDDDITITEDIHPDPALGTPDGSAKVQIDPIPAEWNSSSTKEFDVPAGGTDKANFDIVGKKK